MPKRVLTEMNKPKFEEILEFASRVARTVPETEKEKISDEIDKEYGKQRRKLFFHLLHKFDGNYGAQRFRKALLWDDGTVEHTFHR